MKVKICGVTTPGDAEAAIEAGADALGFNGFRGSKRYLDLAAASDWIVQLPPLVTRVAVLVNPTLEEALAIAALPGIDVLQFHGDETPEFCSRFPGFIRALSVRDAGALRERASTFSTRSLLLDAFVPGAYGGTGHLIDLELAAAFVAERRGSASVLLSGGLTPENVAGAVERVRPYGVDIASGVESAPGRKDRCKMRDFIAAAKGAISAISNAKG